MLPLIPFADIVEITNDDNCDFLRVGAMVTRSSRESGAAMLACTECRKQHLKCDASKPSCSRCTNSGSSCHYIPSRRGGRRKPRHDPIACPSRSAPQIIIPDSTNIASQPEIQENLNSNNITQNGIPSTLQVNTSNGLENWPTFLPGADSNNVFSETPIPQDDRFIRLFYENFHQGHPILVPRSLYQEQNYPVVLRSVVDYVGSHYIPSGPSLHLRNKVDTSFANAVDRSPFTVQAWLIYSVALHSQGDRNGSKDAFSRSVEMALELGMNRKEFAASYSSTAIQAESFRRTWWELYILDILMAVPFETMSVRSSVTCTEALLPCEEATYARGRDIPLPQTTVEFKRRMFASQEIVFSSFSYRMEASTILHRVLVLNRLQECPRDHIQAIENALVSWVNHLPPQKLDVIDCYGTVDEMMFQAHIIVAYAAMLLHLPRSDLRSLSAGAADRFWPLPVGSTSTSSAKLAHAIKATDGSRRITDFISLSPNMQKHTPLLIPALSLSGMVQVATSTGHSDDCFDHHCNRITLVLGCLKSAKRIWNSAEEAYERVKSSAAEALSDSIARWSAEPSKGPAVPNQSPRNENSQTSQYLQTPATPAEDRDQLLPDITLGMIDPTCYNSSFLSTLDDFNII
ncbi:hypothetical protein BU24DRAFT_416892 [Aaosphaeria arxii CBS 175.79]|uniref:Zn(2)-C6 fungal-type domain-containing protein n=1 Tax=Aaosphaeria arxii CBS 175.79 TaxID=1450172 RepID=A0A6A5Y7G5_9PLEO|nr:uncharacterized protein BU24DRAFT_416892 [Aaosphaeria arxii CBS 175.79]KAF2021236.1 hypothetical protein BU24DRAFT_416892 [Aaosphaeria arxii CBS 175.79]